MKRVLPRTAYLKVPALSLQHFVFSKIKKCRVGRYYKTRENLDVNQYEELYKFSQNHHAIIFKVKSTDQVMQVSKLLQFTKFDYYIYQELLNFCGFRKKLLANNQ